MIIEFVKQIEERGVVGHEGQKIFGTAALLRFLHSPIKDLCQDDIESGRRWLDAYLKRT